MRLLIVPVLLIVTVLLIIPVLFTEAFSFLTLSLREDISSQPMLLPLERKEENGLVSWLSFYLFISELNLECTTESPS